MPVITVAMFSGRTQREKDRFAEAITQDAVKILGVEKKDVIVVFALVRSLVNDIILKSVDRILLFIICLKLSQVLFYTLLFHRIIQENDFSTSNLALT